MNIHVRQQLERHGTCPAHVFDKNWCIHAMCAVTSIRGADAVVHPSLRDALAIMPPFVCLEGAGLRQLLQYTANNVAATARNNADFRRRVHSYVCACMGKVPDESSLEQRRAHKLRLTRLAASICALTDEKYALEEEDARWVAKQRQVLTAGRAPIHKGRAPSNTD